MKCIKNCDCNHCEMLMVNEPITFIKINSDGTRKKERLVGVKCMNYGTYAESPKKLKTSELLDNLIFIE